MDDLKALHDQILRDFPDAIDIKVGVELVTTEDGEQYRVVTAEVRALLHGTDVPVTYVIQRKQEAPRWEKMTCNHYGDPAKPGGWCKKCDGPVCSRECLARCRCGTAVCASCANHNPLYGTYGPACSERCGDRALRQADQERYDLVNPPEFRLREMEFDVRRMELNAQYWLSKSTRVGDDPLRGLIDEGCR